MSEEEFDELLDLMSENNLTQHGADTLYGEIVDREIERKRLNNIINELEKWLKQQYGLDKEEWEYESPYIWYEHITLEFVLNKLQELKGNSKQ